MRIFVAIPRSPNPTFASELWKANLHDPLVAMGHDTVLWDGGTLALFDMDPADPATGPARERFGAAFRAAVDEANRAGRLDLVLTYYSSSHLAPEIVAGIRERVAPVANFFCNNIHQFHLIRDLAPSFTTNLVPEAGALDAYRAVGARVDFFPMAANPDVYRRVDVPVRYEASFAGQRYGDRASQILALRRAGIAAHAFGQGWSVEGPGAAPARGTAEGGGPGRMIALLRAGRNPLIAARDRVEWTRLQRDHPDALHPPARDDAYVRLFSESAVSLGFLVLGDTHRTLRPLRQVRLREFEAPMAGAFYLTEHLDELALHYEIGREIVTYRSRAELIERCRHYVTHEAERERIRNAGHARARRDHTWIRRFEGLFAAMRERGDLKRG